MSTANVLGVLSLIFWSVVVVVTLKYLVFVLRADNQGEGGILALMALVHGQVKGRAAVAGRRHWACSGRRSSIADGVLTPAISVLGAIGGPRGGHPGPGPASWSRSPS